MRDDEASDFMPNIKRKTTKIKPQHRGKIHVHVHVNLSNHMKSLNSKGTDISIWDICD